MIGVGIEECFVKYCVFCFFVGCVLWSLCGFFVLVGIWVGGGLVCFFV